MCDRTALITSLRVTPSRWYIPHGTACGSHAIYTCGTDMWAQTEKYRMRRYLDCRLYIATCLVQRSRPPQVQPWPSLRHLWPFDWVSSVQTLDYNIFPKLISNFCRGTYHLLACNPCTRNRS